MHSMALAAAILGGFDVICLALFWLLARSDAKSVCVCEDSDNCVCGGAWGEPWGSGFAAFERAHD